MAYKFCAITILFVLNVYVCLVNGYPKLKTHDSKHSYKFFTRKDWGAEEATLVRPITKPVPYVVIHHTYLPAACNTTEQCFSAMKSMQNYHNSLGWGDIGYHFCVGSNGGVFEGRGWDTLGIHAGRANNFSIGICLIGDWREATPPKAMLKSTKKLISVGVKNGSLSPTYKLVGHSQIMATECPGTALLNIISTWDHFTTEVTNFTTD
ncbi:peptidoglycan-recognition protein LB-like [Battus philenor]|uniref:peptidoglycan-recognition protein LB-like n=1 Tax=Battus philenor TaxID=42288 RepID=UPI0035CEF778